VDQRRAEVADPDKTGTELLARREQVRSLEEEVARLRAHIAELEGDRASPTTGSQPTRAWTPRLFPTETTATPLRAVTNDSPPETKVALYRSLFIGRDDVYAYRWENATTGKTGWAPAAKPGRKRRGEQPELLPLTDDVVAEHLSGRFTAGLYPLMRGDVCRLLVCDLDGAGWQLDALPRTIPIGSRRSPVDLLRRARGRVVRAGAGGSTPARGHGPAGGARSDLL
jgi:hypothetical protein